MEKENASERLEAVVAETTFRNDENGYSVVQVKSGRERVVAVGVLPELAPGEQVILDGSWTTHPQYGRQWKATGVEIIKPTTLLGIEKYLGSGLIKGVGPATAKLLVSYFGKDTLEVMETQPQRIAEVPKIGTKRAVTIAQSFLEQVGIRQSMVFLQSYGVSPALAVRISKFYGEATQNIIRQNPYRMVEEIEGVGFPTADRIALSMGIAADSEFRVRSGITYALKDAAVSGGHTYLPQAELVRRAIALLHVSEDMIAYYLKSLLLSRQLVQAPSEDGETGIALPLFFDAEREIAQRLCEMMRALPYHKDDTVASGIAKYEKEHHVSFSPQQQKAIRGAAEEGMLVVTGGPGTGKTTIINCIIHLLSKEGKVLLCAPTGRAAKRMSEATGVEAKTIHRLLEYGGEDGEFSKNQEDPLDAAVVICDEMSMVDALLMRSLLRAMVPGTRLILVGDADQLPSVGAGNVLEDILKSDVIPSVRLTEIFRQDENSMIVLNAHKINHGEMPVLNGKNTDFFFERKNDFQEAAQSIVQLVTRRLPSFMKWPEKEWIEQAVRSIQVLSPTKKGDCGVWTLNRLLQQAVNPEQPGRASIQSGDTVFRVNDKVMQTQNDYQLEWYRKGLVGREEGKGVFNGDVGYIQGIDREEQTVTVHFDDDRIVTYEGTQKEALELAYCLSVHKSQGSEFPVVVMPVVGGPPMLLTRNLFYTALTRARQLVVLVGREDAIRAMVNNNHIARRYTSLKQRLEEQIQWAPDSKR